MRRLVSIVAGLWLLLFAGVTRADVLTSVPCVEIKAEAAACLRATLAENHSAPRGRKISLDIVVLKASSAPVPALEPIFILEGGPGQRTTDSVDFEANMWVQLRRHRDLVFVDQRGTGTTPDLHCTKADEQDDRPLIDLWPAKTLKNCAVRLALSADLNQYATSEAAKDLESVRTALGYKQIQILAYSYGTRLAQEYVRRYGTAVRAQVLLGPQAPGEFVPAGMAQNEENSLRQVVALCQLDKKCQQTFPTFEEDIQHLRFLGNESPTPVPNDTSPLDEMSQGLIASYLRYRLYSAAGSATLPKLFRELNDQRSVTQQRMMIKAWREQFTFAAPWGMYMSVVCNEDIPFIDAGLERESARGTLLGSYRIDQQVRACANWPRHPIPTDFHSPVTSSVPSLLIVGQLDPATPPEKSKKILAGLTKGLLIVVPNRSHLAIAATDRCLKEVVEKFLEQAVAVPLSADCINQLAFPAFDTSPS